MVGKSPNRANVCPLGHRNGPSPQTLEPLSEKRDELNGSSMATRTAGRNDPPPSMDLAT